MSTNHPTIAMQCFMQGLANEIKDCRTASYDFAVEASVYNAIGQTVAALNLEAITGQQYDRLTAMAMNAASLRREELLLKHPAHSRAALQSYQQRQAAKKQVTA
ncbi:MAG: hypothetical protein KJ989_15365 [Gammaproteobacteria bacterium]|uniref:Uncharacterized protein n=1 Tax=viral metagenome TaxID=1070528 RepID=A0A6M3J4H2_9ZZZZ|nr:hypothetical protein [Gammaproteobacteria bacterium]MBU2067496.1 hypothetical protein [Gammaproteobacteria bacterium]MBU2139506.1 hypothetical protein [Gammaproteobacteria bacterium]MBU2255934.1 hypothetical protein [Gammaproteobacteria bacterium]MBU2295579.1 hypothetical protein [Gammaproteobacteria bacterium]